MAERRCCVAENISGGHLKTTEQTRTKKIIQTVFILAIYCIFGLLRGQEGLTFLDLISLTNSNITNGSLMFSVSAFGYVLGALLLGVLYDRVNNDVLHGACVTLVGLFTVMIPWCDSLPLMIAVCGLRGLFLGPADSGSSVMCAKIWRLKTGPVLQALQFLFAVGGIISPFLTEPFLLYSNGTRLDPEDGLDNENQPLATTKNLSIFNVSYIEPFQESPMLLAYGQNASELQLNLSGNGNLGIVSPQKSPVYIAFLISGCVLLALSISFLFKSCFYSCADFDDFNQGPMKNDKTMKRSNHLESYTCSTKIICYLLIAGNLFAFGCVEKIYMSFSITFVIEYLGWSKLNGSISSGVFWAGFAVGRFAAIFLTNFFRARIILLISFTGLLLIQMLMVLVEFCSLPESLWWVLIGGSGLTIGPVFASTISWINFNLTPVSGKLVSFLYFWFFTGAMTNMYLLGYLFENASAMWYVYLLLIYTSLAFATGVGLLVVIWRQSHTHAIINNYKCPLEDSQEIRPNSKPAYEVKLLEDPKFEPDTNS